MAFNVVLFGLKLPDPPDHIPPVAMLTDPFKLSVGLFPQTDLSKPALMVGAEVKEILTWSLTAVQFPFPVLVRVRLTIPALISAAEGV